LDDFLAEEEIHLDLFEEDPVHPSLTGCDPSSKQDIPSPRRFLEGPFATDFQDTSGDGGLASKPACP